jgi:hypothetical protein
MIFVRHTGRPTLVLYVDLKEINLLNTSLRDVIIELDCGNLVCLLDFKMFKIS